MTAASNDAIALVHLLGFVTGLVLYALLLAMALRASPMAHADEGKTSSLSGNRLPLAAALLGVVWNAGGFASLGLREFGLRTYVPALVAGAFTALSFLPAVLVHSALRSGRPSPADRIERLLIGAAYGLSAFAGALHFFAAVVDSSLYSYAALRMLTAGFALLAVVMLFRTRRQPGWQRALWGVGLSLFAVTALHLSGEADEHASSWREIVGHHASVLLAVAILYQDYRFAFADLFLKQALKIVLLIGLASTLYLSLARRLLAVHDVHGDVDPRAIGAILGLWVSTALVYPAVRRLVDWFVGSVILRRPDYVLLRAEAARRMMGQETEERVLDETCGTLAPALDAREIRWAPLDGTSPELETLDWHFEHASSFRALELSEPSGEHRVRTLIPITTAEPPQYVVIIAGLSGGRRLLSDDLAMLETIALAAARRIDFLRVTQERYAQSLREQEIRRLATEAELRALRAQINPHFLFNALTTIGYLIQTAPARALGTLMRLTELLRGVLRTSSEFVALGEELDLVASYLDIERERFGEKLRVTFAIPPDLRSVRIPALLVQPLVENAIKHGIAPSRAGGEVVISACWSPGETLCVSVADTGLGAEPSRFATGGSRGLGLLNIRQRLERHFGPVASLEVTSAPGAGTTVEARFPARPTFGREEAREWSGKTTDLGQ